MWRSVDSVRTLRRLQHPSSYTPPPALCRINAPAYQHWYYGTGEQYAVVNAAGFVGQFAGDGIFKSTDGGLTWALLPSTMSDTIPNPLFQPRNF